jgi:hypothetical protein
LVSINATDIQAKGGQANAQIPRRRPATILPEKITRDSRIYINPKVLPKKSWMI